MAKFVRMPLKMNVLPPCKPRMTWRINKEWMLNNKWRNTCMLWRSRIISVGQIWVWTFERLQAEMNERMTNAVIKWSLNRLPNAQISSDVIGQNPSWWFGWDRFKRSSSCFVIPKNACHCEACRHAEIVGQIWVLFLTSWVTMRREIVENEAVFLVRMTWPWPGFSCVLSAFCSAFACTVASRDRLLYCRRVFSFRFFFCNLIRFWLARCSAACLDSCIIWARMTRIGVSNIDMLADMVEDRMA